MRWITLKKTSQGAEGFRLPRKVRKDKLTFLTGGWLGGCSSGEESSAKFKGKSTGWGWKGSSSCSEEPSSFPRTTCQTLIEPLPLPGEQVALNSALLRAHMGQLTRRISNLQKYLQCLPSSAKLPKNILLLLIK